jgi:ribosomal protein S10
MDNESKKCKLPRCGESFIPTHLNESYCCEEHKDEAKRDRQKLQRDCYKRFIPIYIKNNEIMADLFAEEIKELTAESIEKYGLDLSLCRICKAQPEYPESILMDFGAFYLLTDKNFLTFKLYKHETADSTVQSA